MKTKQSGHRRSENQQNTLSPIGLRSAWVNRPPALRSLLFGGNTPLTPFHVAGVHFCRLPSSAFAVTITSSLTIAENDLTCDGQDMVISGTGVTVAIDGPHAFNSLLLTNGAVLTHSPCTAHTSFSM